MTIKEAAKELNWTELFLREAIAQGVVNFGVCVQMPGSSKRIFKINEAAFRRWKEGRA